METLRNTWTKTLSFPRITETATSWCNYLCVKIFVFISSIKIKWMQSTQHMLISPNNTCPYLLWTHVCITINACSYRPPTHVRIGTYQHMPVLSVRQHIPVLAINTSPNHTSTHVRIVHQHIPKSHLNICPYRPSAPTHHTCTYNPLTYVRIVHQHIP